MKIIEGHDSEIRLFGDRVLKIHAPAYFDHVEHHGLMGESHWLDRFRNFPQAVQKLCGWDGGLWLERLAFPLGTATGVSATATARLAKLGMTPDVLCDTLAEGVRELSRHATHRDVHPGNVIGPTTA